MSETRTCNECGDEQPIEEYVKCGGGRRRGKCRTCRSRRRNADRRDHRLSELEIEIEGARAAGRDIERTGGDLCLAMVGHYCTLDFWALLIRSMIARAIAGSDKAAKWLREEYKLSLDCQATADGERSRMTDAVGEYVYQKLLELPDAREIAQNIPRAIDAGVQALFDGEIEA